jgi:hypothetical protein
MGFNSVHQTCQRLKITEFKDFNNIHSITKLEYTFKTASDHFAQTKKPTITKMTKRPMKRNHPHHKQLKRPTDCEEGAGSDSEKGNSNNPNHSPQSHPNPHIPLNPPTPTLGSSTRTRRRSTLRRRSPRRSGTRTRCMGNNRRRPRGSSSAASGSTGRCAAARGAVQKGGKGGELDGWGGRGAESLGGVLGCVLVCYGAVCFYAGGDCAEEGGCCAVAVDLQRVSLRSPNI